MPISFACAGTLMHGMVHLARVTRATGVLIVVGGPQYRVGSHRQFLLLSRALASDGIPVMRFDYRGMGDSDGEQRTFEEVNADIAAAIDRFTTLPGGPQRVVLWGLCDAASAILFYAAQDRRVCGLTLLNPWVRSGQTVARTYLKHYYASRALDPQAWRALLSGPKSLASVAQSVIGTVRAAIWPRTAGTAATAPQSLGERMLQGWNAFEGPILLVLSGDDVTAAEFLELAGSSRRWRKALTASRVERRDLPAADHTFSSQAWRDQVADWTRSWVNAHWPHTVTIA